MARTYQDYTQIEEVWDKVQWLGCGKGYHAELHPLTGKRMLAGLATFLRREGFSVRLHFVRFRGEGPWITVRKMGDDDLPF